MPIPTAVSPSTVTPGLYLSINLLSGAGSPGGSTLKVLLLAPKSASGTLTVDTEIRTGGSPDLAATAFGSGTAGHLAAKQIYAMEPTAQIDFGAPTAGATAATLNVTAAGSPASNTSVHFDVCGREFDVAWNSGESADTFKTRAIAAIAAKTTDLPVTASSGGVGVVTISSKVTGKIGNDVRVKATLNLSQTGTETLTGAATYTNLAGGTTDPDFTTILSAANGTEYAYILLCLSNADVETAGGSSNVARLLTFINAANTGLNAHLQQGVACSTSATFTAAQAAAIARNSGVLEYVYARNARSLPCELAARELGGRLDAVLRDPAANRIGEIFTGTGNGVYGSGAVVTDTMTAAELETCLTNGLTPLNFTPQGQLYLVRPITTYSQDTSGGADRRLLDVQNVDATYAVARDLRTALPAQFPNAKIAKDASPGAEPPPPGVVEERDIKAFVIGRLRFWARSGVILKATLDSVIADGSLIVQVNASDPTQVDIVVPIVVVPPLAKMGVTVQRRSA